MGSYLALLFIGAFAFYANADERNRALSQFCLQQENLHQTNITDLKRTYNYLTNLTPEQGAESFNQAIIRFLPDTEKRAAIDDAPAVCDETYKSGILGLGGTHEYGNPEPDPIYPSRPKEIGKLPGSEFLPPQPPPEDNDSER